MSLEKKSEKMKQPEFRCPRISRKFMLRELNDDPLFSASDHLIERESENVTEKFLFPENHGCHKFPFPAERGSHPNLLPAGYFILISPIQVPNQRFRISSFIYRHESEFRTGDSEYHPL